MIETFIGYGYNLGGPGEWHLKEVASGDVLRTPWYDEADPTHDFAERAMATIINREPCTRGVDGGDEYRLEPIVQCLIETAIDVSPPGWTPEASAPPTPSAVAAASYAWDVLDAPANLRYVLIVLESIEDVDPDAGESIGDPPRPEDWDTLLEAALAQTGLRAAGSVGWLWFRTGTRD